MSYVVYDTLLGKEAGAHCRNIRVDKHVSLDEAMRSAQLRFIRFSRAPEPGLNASLDRVTVKTSDGQIVFELPTTSMH